ncbi:ABC transporter permease [Gammaproteobacteria bacterium]|nr:ABC transporter permease [Gammaproteobacteria bacterium]
MAQRTLLNIKLAISSLNRNRLRSVLTMLGVIIGVAAVLTMVALGTGARGSVEQEVTSAGTNLVYVKSGNYTRGGEGVGILSGAGAADTLSIADSEEIDRLQGVRDISPGNSLRTFTNIGGSQSFVRIQGVSEAFARMYAWQFLAGGNFESESSQQVILGRALANEVFGPDLNVIGSNVNLRNSNFEIVGVIDDSADDHSEVLFIPWRTLQSTIDKENLDSVVVSTTRAGEAASVADEIRLLLRQRHGIINEGNAEARSGYLSNQGGVGGVPDDFTVETQAEEVLTKGLYTPAAAFALANLPKLDQVNLEEMTDTLDKASGTMTALLASIAGASLFVGGIGIMNIMLVSITERTKEIGLRMATGAKKIDVSRQFLVEAVTLSSVGGFIGLFFGLVLARVVSFVLGWPAQVTLTSVLVALGVAAAVGVVFGYYPAQKAAMLDPIDALRAE